MQDGLPNAISPIVNRDPKYIPTDVSALRAIAQAAVDVELFTIPLYMTTLYSIQGMHEINASEQTFYRGRRWPGSSTKRAPATANDRAFNIIFSVFIQEMLHLQLAANLAASMGVTPKFTGPALQTPNFGWKCFGPEKTTIPHIIDLKDTTTYADIKVALGPLNEKQLDLFLAIEEPEDQARKRIEPSKRKDYFPAVPFAGWTPEKTDLDLPLFGTIGYMYECMVAYMTMRYSDGKTLWELVYTPSAVQREIFNTPSGGHPMGEYPGFSTLVPTTSALEALGAAVDMAAAITDQGEGKTISKSLKAKLHPFPKALFNLSNEVQTDYRSSHKALKLDYPSYDAEGTPVPSADAEARFGNDAKDHYSRFLEIKRDHLPHVVTWEKWHAQHGAAAWTEKDLLTGEPIEPSSKIPSAADVAAALNRLKAKNVDRSVFRQLSHVAAGAIAGVTQVLDDYWQDPTTAFPYPSMGGSGDRVSICWAVLGEAPNLALGIEEQKQGVLYNSCQGLSFATPGTDTMPAVATFHSCKGSNACKGQGGCGFVQSVQGGGNCSSSGGGGGCGFTVKSQVLCGGPPSPGQYSAPADNKCKAFGGCAVPISASQLYPTAGTMQLYILSPNADSKPAGTLSFAYGDPVYDIAWQAYCQVLIASGKTPPASPPPPDDLRLAFPPST